MRQDGMGDTVRGQFLADSRDEHIDHAEVGQRFRSHAHVEQPLSTDHHPRRQQAVEQRRLGALSASVVGVGCNNFGARLDQAGATAVVAEILALSAALGPAALVADGTLSPTVLATADSAVAREPPK